MPGTRSKARAPASRVYSSTPVPQQVHFPSRQRSVRTYGKQGNKRALRQQTITQIDFLEPLGPEELDELEAAEDREFERRKKKRRRTESDFTAGVEEPAVEGKGKKDKGRRKTEGGLPSSSFHTQTLTQFLGDETIGDSEDEDGVEVGGVEGGMGAKSPSVIPQTPLKRRILAEIPSSQPSPCTPILARYSPLGPRASPLKSRSTNVGSPLPTVAKLRRTPRGLTIQDSFASGVTMESGVSQVSATGVKGGDSSEGVLSSGGKRARMVMGGDNGEKKVFQMVEIPDSDDDDDFDISELGDMTALTIPDTPTKQLGSSYGSQNGSRSSGRKLPRKPDDGNENLPATPTRRLGHRTPDGQNPSGSSPKHAVEEERVSGENESSKDDGENSYPVGPDTQFAMDFIASSEESALRLSRAPSSSRPAVDMAKPRSSPQSKPVHEFPTRKTTPRRPQKKPASVHFSSPHVSFEDELRSSDQHKTQAYTQMGSQRVDFDVIRSMPPATGRSDVFISVHPDHVANIASGVKDHEFRNWKMPPTISRAWIYVTQPASRVRYMACVGPAKEKGEIEDERGLGNAEFNRGEGGNKFAHEILELYELNNPVSMRKLRENGWLDKPPQKFTYVPPVVVSHLQANLRCRVLPREDDEDENEFEDGLQESQPRDSQEVEAQLLSDIAYSTQRPVDAASSQGIMSLPRGSSPPSIPRSSQRLRDAGSRRTPRVSKSGPPSSTPRSLRNQHRIGRGQAGLDRQDHQVISWSQATTASDDSVPGATDSVPRPVNTSSSIPVFQDSGSPARVPEGDWAVNSSQLVGRSQLLPDSLLRDCGPPEGFDL